MFLVTGYKKKKKPIANNHFEGPGYRTGYYGWSKYMQKKTPLHITVQSLGLRLGAGRKHFTISLNTG